MGTVNIRPRIHRTSDIPSVGLQIGSRGDRWEEEFIKNIDFSTMDNPTDWSYLFRNSKAYDFDLRDMDSSAVTNMDYMFNKAHAGTLRLAGLIVGNNTSASNFLSGSFDAVDFTGATFYSLPSNMFNGASVSQGLQLRTLDVSHLTSLAYMFSNASLSSLDLTGFNTRTITDMSHMFDHANIPILTGLNTLNYSNVINASFMFYQCIIPEVNMSNINFTSLESTSYMFNINDVSQAKNVNLSGSSFPSLTDASYMFYTYIDVYIAPPRRFGLRLNLSNTDFSAYQINANYMFYGVYEPNGLDLSCFTNTKISNGMCMFQNAALGETDFTKLDFSVANSGTFYGGNGAFYGCYTPTVHIKTAVPYNVMSCEYGPFTYSSKINECILELTMRSSMVRLGNFIYSDNYGPEIFRIKNSELYGSNTSYFIKNNNNSNFDLKFENSILHVGNNASSNNFIASSYGGIIDMRDLVIDGTFYDSQYFNYLQSSSYSCTIYYPNTGIKFSGALKWFTYQSSYIYNTYYNMDKCDVSAVTSLYGSLFNCMIGTYDLSGWDMSNVKSANSYFIYHCSGDFNLSGWDLSGITNNGYSSPYLFYDFNGNLNVSDWDLSNLTNISQICYDFQGHLDIRNWNINNCTSLYACNVKGESTIDFDGWVINANKNMTNCYLLGAYGNSTIYVPNTVHKPNSYAGTMFYCQIPTTYSPGNVVVDLYTNATSVEAQGWTINHIYSDAEPYGYRIHLNSTHNDFLNAIEEVIE